MRVLLVEDDSATAASIEMMLRAEGFICDTTDLGEDGLEIGKLYDYDIIILDLMLPDIDGYDVLRRLRAARVRTPILILSGLAELDHKIKGLGFGADDFLTKPFDRRELIARIQAIVRRAKGHSESLIRTGKLTVNLDSRTVEVEGHPVNLTGKEYGILELLSLQRHDADQRDVPQSSLWRHGRARAQDHRRVRLQAAQEVGASDGRRQLHRHGLGPRLCAARSAGRCRRRHRAAAQGRSESLIAFQSGERRPTLGNEGGVFFWARGAVGAERRAHSRIRTRRRERESLLPKCARIGTEPGR